MTTNTDSTLVNRISVKIPPFWPTDPELWFTQVENQFSLAGVSTYETKFNYVAGDLESKYAVEPSPATILKYMPAGASYKSAHHYQQSSEKGTDFQQYDAGCKKNKVIYGSRNPPVYNLTNVVAPLYMYYGTNDGWAVPKDVLYAVKHLPNVQKLVKVPDDQFTHLDFMWANNAKTLVYDEIISTLHNLTSVS